MEVLESHYFHIPYPGALKALRECGQARGLRWKPEASCQAERRRREKERERRKEIKRGSSPLGHTKVEKKGLWCGQSGPSDQSNVTRLDRQYMKEILHEQVIRVMAKVLQVHRLA